MTRNNPRKVYRVYICLMAFVLLWTFTTSELTLLGIIYNLGSLLFLGLSVFIINRLDNVKMQFSVLMFYAALAFIVNYFISIINVEFINYNTNLFQHENIYSKTFLLFSFSTFFALFLVKIILPSQILQSKRIVILNNVPINNIVIVMLFIWFAFFILKIILQVKYFVARPGIIPQSVPYIGTGPAWYLATITPTIACLINMYLGIKHNSQSIIGIALVQFITLASFQVYLGSRAGFTSVVLYIIILVYFIKDDMDINNVKIFRILSILGLVSLLSLPVASIFRYSHIANYEIFYYNDFLNYINTTPDMIVSFLRRVTGFQNFILCVSENSSAQDSIQYPNVFEYYKVVIRGISDKLIHGEAVTIYGYFYLKGLIYESRIFAFIFLCLGMAVFAMGFSLLIVALKKFYIKNDLILYPSLVYITSLTIEMYGEGTVDQTIKKIFAALVIGFFFYYVIEFISKSQKHK